MARNVTAGDVIERLVQAYLKRVDARGLSTGQAATSLGVTESTVKRWCASGRMECTVGAGRHRRIAAEEVARVASELPERDGPIPYVIAGVDLGVPGGSESRPTLPGEDEQRELES